MPVRFHRNSQNTVDNCLNSFFAVVFSSVFLTKFCFYSYVCVPKRTMLVDAYFTNEMCGCDVCGDANGFGQNFRPSEGRFAF